MLVVLRVVSGRAWTRDKSSMIGSQLEFTGRSTTRIDNEDDEKNEKDSHHSHVMTSSGSVDSSSKIAEEV